MEKIRLLYVEDEPFLGKIVKESLESRQFDVHMVTDGALVLDALNQFEPDICVLDVMLPNMDGFAVAEALRKKRPGLPIVFVTAKTTTDDVLQGFAAGGNDYVRKPFSMEELIVRLHNLLALSGSKTANDAIPIGKYRFYPHKYELVLGEQLRKLSAREAELLKILLEYRRGTADRREILQRVWGDDNFFNSRNLDVYITKLRDYFRDDPSVEIITLKGVGYHFVA